MTRPKLVVPLLALAALAIALAPGGSAASTRHPCRFHGDRTVASNRGARIFRVSFRGETDTWYGGCLYADGVPRLVDFDGLDVESVEDTVSALALAGHYVAVGHDLQSDGGLDQSDVTVLDLRRGQRGNPFATDAPVRFHGQARTVHHAAATVADRQHDVVRALVLRPNGAVAWIGEDVPAAIFEVHALGAAGDRVLDSGRGIDPASLRLAGDLLSWTSGGAARTATLR
jgi:hypothetical protein